MNKVRIIGLGFIFLGLLSGYYSENPGVFIFSGMLIGLGAGWIITGRLHVGSKKNRLPVDNK